MKAILAIDQGTTASKAALFSFSGRILGLGRVPVRTRMGPGGRAEQDPEEILATQRLAIRRAAAGAGRHQIVAAGIASQRSTFILWDRETGRPAGLAPTWQSTVAADVCSMLGRHASRVRRLTGLPLSPHYSASKLARLLHADGGLRRRAERGDLLFGPVATFLIWHLTGGRTHAADPTQAARTLMSSLDDVDWHPWLLELFGVPRVILPEVRPSLGDFGSMRQGRDEIPIRACLGDQQAVLLASTRWTGRDGGRDTLVNYGTGAFVLIPTGARVVRRAGLLTSLAWTTSSRREYLLEGTINAAGSALDWLRRDLGAPLALGAIDSLCRRGSGSALVLPAFHGLGSIFFDEPGGAPPSVILGAGPTGTLADVTRATIESIAHMVAMTLQRASGLRAARGRLVASGPLSTLRYLVQFQSALAPRSRVVASRSREATLTGIARAAALSLGGGAAEAAKRWKHEETQVRAPARLARAARESHERWRRMVEWARRWR